MKVYEDRVAEITDTEAFRICLVPPDKGFQLANATVMNGVLLIAFRRVAIEAEVAGVMHNPLTVEVAPAAAEPPVEQQPAGTVPVPGYL